MEISRDDIPSDYLVKYDNPFLRLSVENYLKLIGIEPKKPQIAFLNAINNPKYRFITAALSRRTGKSFIANIIGQLVVLVPNSSILIMSPNYSLSQISWDLQKKLLSQFDVEIEKSNVKDKTIELSNGSTIRMGSISQADSVVGRSYDLIIFDEAALNDKGMDVFQVQLRPTLDKKDAKGNPTSKAIFISTPRGRNWFYDIWIRGFSDDKRFDAYASIRSTWKDNPSISQADIDEARATMSRAFFEQEYECSFNAVQGLIYNLSPDQVTSDIPERVEEVFAGLDIGYRDATAMVVIANDGHNFYILEEYVDSAVSTEMHAREIQKLIDKWSIDSIYIDSAAAQTRADLAMTYDISTINAKKSINDGIGAVAALVDNNRLFVSPSCRHTIEGFNNYRWNPDAIREVPIHDSHSHIMDAVRYAVYSHSLNLIR